ncbi:chromate transporter [Bradyrhizobium sp. USDA 4486]
MNELPALVRVFAYLSLLTVSGGIAAFPEMKTLTVGVHQWLTFPQLVHFYSVGPLAPGPNMMMIFPWGLGGRPTGLDPRADRVFRTDGAAHALGRPMVDKAREMAVTDIHSTVACTRLDRAPPGGNASPWRKVRSSVLKPPQSPAPSC